MRKGILAALLVLFTALPARAQRFTATIRGTVKDSTGAVVPGAQVALKGEDTGLGRTTTTNASGIFSFTELPVGTYQIEVGLSGFKSAVLTHVALNVADVRAVDVVLAAGAVSEQVTVEAAARHFGKLDILVNNAGLGPSNLALAVSEEDFDLTVAVNLKGTFFASQAAGRVMTAQRRGRIINLGSQAGAVALPTESVYCMTKAAISHLTRCLAVEWGPFNVTVNAVAPTFIRTPGTEEALADDAFRASVLSRIALGRIGEPMEVAGAVVYLASPAASLITGATLLVDGGWTAH